MPTRLLLDPFTWGVYLGYNFWRKLLLWPLNPFSRTGRRKHLTVFLGQNTRVELQFHTRNSCHVITHKLAGMLKKPIRYLLQMNIRKSWLKGCACHSLSNHGNNNYSREQGRKKNIAFNSKNFGGQIFVFTVNQGFSVSGLILVFVHFHLWQGRLYWQTGFS